VLTALQVHKDPGENEFISSSQECVQLTKSVIESKILRKNIYEIWILRQRSTNPQRWCCLVRLFLLPYGCASKRDIISTRLGTRQFIPTHVEDAKHVFQEMSGSTTVTIFWSSRSLKFIDMGLASSLSVMKCSKRSLACVF